MATMNFGLPDDLLAAFNKAFAGTNKNVLLTELMRQALVLDHIGMGRVSALQPPHWLAEVAAVVSRLEPTRTHDVIGLLHAMEFPVTDAADVYHRACELAVALRQHVFDTLYHAVALSRPAGVLVTADERYYRRAVGAGRVTLLRDYR